MMRKRVFSYLLFFIVLLVAVYLLGPHPAKPVYNADLPVVPASAPDLERFIDANEGVHHLKPDNQARIVWYNDSSKEKTEYSIVYLHGFSASQMEGAPVHTNIAAEFGCNLFLSRLAEHGMDTTEPMKNLTPGAYWESAKQALAIGQQIGKKVILMGTSTGGSLALQLAAAFPEEVQALVLMSPNIAIHDDNAWMLNNPWGQQVAEWVVGSRYLVSADTRPVYKQYWYHRYPLDAAVQLQEYLETAMTPETFKKVKQPVLMLYYFRDEEHQDQVVSVPAMLRMFEELGTPRQQKIKQAMPDAGDHVLGSYIKSKDLLHVQQAIEQFMLRQLRLTKVGEDAVITTTTDVKITNSN